MLAASSVIKYRRGICISATELRERVLAGFDCLLMVLGTIFRAVGRVAGVVGHVCSPGCNRGVGFVGHHVNPNPVVGHNRPFRAIVSLLERDETVVFQFREITVNWTDVVLKQSGKLADARGLVAAVSYG